MLKSMDVVYHRTFIEAIRLLTKSVHFLPVPLQFCDTFVILGRLSVMRL